MLKRTRFVLVRKTSMTHDMAITNEGVGPPTKTVTGIRRSFAIGVIGFFVLPASMFALLGFIGGRAAWLLDLFNHFWVHYAALFLVATVCLALLRSRRLLVISGLMLALSVWQVWPVILAYEHDVVQNAQAAGSLRLIQFNVNTAAGDPAGVAAYLAKQDADVVFLQEVSEAWMDALGQQVGPYRLVIAEPRSDNFGIACYVRANQDRVVVRTARIVDQTNGLAAVPAIALELSVQNMWGAEFDPLTVPVLSIHTLPPVSGRYAAARDAQLKAAGDWASASGKYAVVIGDLNATPWSKPFVALLEDGKLNNSAKGFGRQTTWPAGLPAVLGIPIDHCLHGGGWHTSQRRVGDSCGSDHRALHVTLKQSGC